MVIFAIEVCSVSFTMLGHIHTCMNMFLNKCLAEVIQDHTKEKLSQIKKCKKAKWLSEEAYK